MYVLVGRRYAAVDNAIGLKIMCLLRDAAAARGHYEFKLLQNVQPMLMRTNMRTANLEAVKLSGETQQLLVLS